MSVGYVEATNRGTRYRIDYAVEGSLVEPEIFLMCTTGFGSGCGEWIRLTQQSVAWSYLAEKMPALTRFDGDKEGWIMAFDAAGIEVFG